MKKWIWQSDNFPKLSYDKKLIETKIKRVEDCYEKIKSFIGKIKNSTLIDSVVYNLANEVCHSWSIEGEVLNHDTIRNSLLRGFVYGFSERNSLREDERIAEAILDCRNGTTNLTLERVLYWHRLIFSSLSYNKFNKIKPGTIRTNEMSVVSGHIGAEKIHYEAPKPELLDDMLSYLFDYIEYSDDNYLIKASIAHFLFLAIHPLDDGNGRIARLISDNILSNGNKLYPSVSKAIDLDRKGYYSVLDKTVKIGETEYCDVTDWIIWHLKKIEHSIELATNDLKELTLSLQIKQEFPNLSKTQQKFIDCLIREPEIIPSLKKYQKITKVTTDIGNDELSELENLGLLNFIKDRIVDSEIKYLKNKKSSEKEKRFEINKEKI